MFFRVGEKTAKYIEKPELVSFETFAKEQNFPISVFENIKSDSKKNSSQNPLIKRTAKLTKEKLLMQYIMLQQEYKRIIEEKAERDMKLAEVEYYIKVIEKNLSFLKSEEKSKFYKAVHRVKSKYGEKGAQKIIRNAELKAWDIFKTGRNTAWNIAYDAKKMVPTKSVEEIKAISFPQVMKVALNSKDNFEDVLENLQNGKY